MRDQYRNKSIQLMQRLYSPFHLSMFVCVSTFVRCIYLCLFFVIPANSVSVSAHSHLSFLILYMPHVCLCTCTSLLFSLHGDVPGGTFAYCKCVCVYMYICIFTYINLFELM